MNDESNTGKDPRAELAKAHLAAALVAAGTPHNVAQYVASTAKVLAVAGSGALLEVDGVRVIDEEASIAGLVAHLLSGPAAAADGSEPVVNDVVSAEAARAAGKAAGAAAKAATAASALAFR